ncbi:MAG: alpha/beta hydrolase [Pseudobutyrivibrio sp.]|nr:alpha/beta hydrolase [Pseudobutyrivibrio sp.]
MKKRKIIGRILGAILGVVVLILAINAIVYRVKLYKVVKELDEQGYYNPVSVGDYSLNVYRCGNESGKHRIVGMSGLGDASMMLSWREMTSNIEKDNEMIFIDRAGYALSDDTDKGRKVEDIVEDYRTALKNSGVEAPYVLMGHSIAGIYATYWESKYPDEIEGVVLLDGTALGLAEDLENQESSSGSFMKTAIEKLGFMPYLYKAEYKSIVGKDYDKDLLDTACYLSAKTEASKAGEAESGLSVDNSVETGKALKSNDIPKIYINCVLGYETINDLEKDKVDTNYALMLLNEYGISTEGLDANDKDKVYELTMDTIEKLREKYTIPYVESIGNCQLVNFPTSHLLFMTKPVEAGNIIEDFIDEL